jgi:hypothetical protein
MPNEKLAGHSRRLKAEREPTKHVRPSEECMGWWATFCPSVMLAVILHSSSITYTLMVPYPVHHEISKSHSLWSLHGLSITAPMARLSLVFGFFLSAVLANPAPQVAYSSLPPASSSMPAYIPSAYSPANPATTSNLGLPSMASSTSISIALGTTSSVISFGLPLSASSSSQSLSPLTDIAPTCSCPSDVGTTTLISTFTSYTTSYTTLGLIQDITSSVESTTTVGTTVSGMTGTSTSVTQVISSVNTIGSIDTYETSATSVPGLTTSSTTTYITTSTVIVNSTTVRTRFVL